MRVSIVAVGRVRRGPEKALYDHYAGRITAFPLVVHEVEDRRTADAGRPAREAALLLAAVPNGAVVVALDGRGRMLDSEGFAERLGRWRDDGVGEVALVIGGADGLDAPLRAGADLVLSLGALTWPHLLVRGLLAEQIYRAQCILGGHPYHRG